MKSVRMRSIFDEFYKKNRMLEHELNIIPEELINYKTDYNLIESLIYEQTEVISKEYIQSNDKQIFLDVFYTHPLHSEMILKSTFARHIYDKPYGYPGDKDLMLMICTNQVEGPSNFSKLQNRVYLSLPAAESVRIRKNSLKRLISNLDSGNVVFNLACGPALEVQEYIKENPNNGMVFYLMDHDKKTIEYLRSKNLGENVILIEGNALKLDSRRLSNFCRNNKLDLAYSSGLFDYVNAQFSHRITKAMFDNLKNGGKLVIGNYLSLDNDNPHKHIHKDMMELYGKWFLNYRTRDEIMSFVSNVDQKEISSIEVSNEYLDKNLDYKSTIGFLVVSKH